MLCSCQTFRFLNEYYWNSLSARETSKRTFWKRSLFCRLVTFDNTFFGKQKSRSHNGPLNSILKTLNPWKAHSKMLPLKVHMFSLIYPELFLKIQFYPCPYVLPWIFVLSLLLDNPLFGAPFVIQQLGYAPSHTVRSYWSRRSISRLPFQTFLI